MTKWEYFYEYASEYSRDTGNGALPDIQTVNDFGSDGWELVAVAPAWGNDPVTFIFKRPLVEIEEK